MVCVILVLEVMSMDPGYLWVVRVGVVFPSYSSLYFLKLTIFVCWYVSKTRDKVAEIGRGVQLCDC